MGGNWKVREGSLHSVGTNGRVEGVEQGACVDVLRHWVRHRYADRHRYRTPLYGRVVLSTLGCDNYTNTKGSFMTS